MQSERTSEPVKPAVLRHERRSDARARLVLRVGLLEYGGRASFCLVKNISSTGVQVKPYGKLAEGTPITMRVGDVDSVGGVVVWTRAGLAGIAFNTALDPESLLLVRQKLAQRRRSAPRVSTDVVALLRTGGSTYRARICDLSVHGARIRTLEPVTFGSNIIVEMPKIPSVKGHLRWAEGCEYGISFEAALPMQIIAEIVSEDHSFNVI